MSKIRCEDCGKEKAPDITGELRCKPCDNFIDDIMHYEFEDAIIRGELDE